MRPGRLRPNPYRFTNLGNSVDMVPRITGRTGNQTELTKGSTRLLRVNLQAEAPERIYDTGAWCLAITSDVIEPAPGGTITYIPLVVDVSIGSGGASHKMTLDAVPGFSLRLPVATVEVDVRWESPLPIDQVAVGLWGVPTKIRVRGTLQRATCEGWGHRSFALNRSNVAIWTTIGEVPPFAKMVMLNAASTNAVYGGPATFTLYEGTGSPSTVALYTGAEVLAIRNAGTAPIPVPARATHWEVNPGAVEANPAYVDFRVGL
ncbi:MAG: hypothetical protein P8Y25_00700 [Chromatiaceae bacterium]